MSKVEDFLTKDQENKIVKAIRTAELHTSGEIRVHIESSTCKDSIERATEVFYYLKMDETKYKTGVLFYLAVDDKKFAIIGDEHIDTKVKDNFWKEIKDIVIKEFKNQHYASGLTKGILIVGKELKHYFPYDEEKDINEHSDEISVG